MVASRAASSAGVSVDPPVDLADRRSDRPLAQAVGPRLLEGDVTETVRPVRPHADSVGEPPERTVESQGYFTGDRRCQQIDEVFLGERTSHGQHRKRPGSDR
jgi:hypothetical protein